VQTLKGKIFESVITNLRETVRYNNIPIFTHSFENANFNELRKAYDAAKKYLKEGSVIFVSNSKNNSFIILVGSVDLKINSLELLSKIKEIANIKGGGDERIAQGSSEERIKLDRIIKFLGEKSE